jgi:hypothetical protein
MHIAVVLAATVAFASVGYAQHAGHRQGQSYAGYASREIKALSSEQIEDLRTGRGMGLALPAELNGYPGPLHVLELADQLALTGAAKNRIRALLADMRTETTPLGEKVIEDERSLDRVFAEQRASPDAIDAAVGRAAISQAALRAAHLRYHLAVRRILTDAQVNRYNLLRGYEQVRSHP